MSSDPNDLELLIKKKIEPLVEEATLKFLGVTIAELNKSIADKLERPFPYTIDTSLPFKKAKQQFKREYLRKILLLNYGNVQRTAQQTGLERRTIHRAINGLGIDIQKIRHEMIKPDYIKQETVTRIIQDSLRDFEGVIHPQRFDRMYHHVPDVTKNLVKELPEPFLSFAQAEAEFERRFLSRALQEHSGNTAQTARAIGVRFETLHRKLKHFLVTNK
ncbi:hypothetical protein HYW21_09080 [Candidatus Woesearchaeota archaeon]|nr:hypothetical protein [Candidatus Woesearchaeota archaeon]